MRLDVYLTVHSFADTRNRAKNLIELGRISVNGKVVDKPAFDTHDGDIIVLSEDYTGSLGSLKLEKAFSDFPCVAADKVCLDIGAANGGFTEVLLRKGAKKVYALDIGDCALSETLQKDVRVIVVDRTNVRYVRPQDFADPIDFISCDVSFISLTLVLPVCHMLLSMGGEGVFLIKPQFELDKKSLPKSGIVKDEKTRRSVIDRIIDFANQTGFTVLGITEAPHPFEYKNQEYLLYVKK